MSRCENVEKNIFKTKNVEKKKNIVRQKRPLSNMCYHFYTKKNISPKRKEVFWKFFFLQNEDMKKQLWWKKKEKVLG